jgi:adenylate cyclase
MLRIFVSNKEFRKRLEHSGGPLEFGRVDGRGDVPRCVIQKDDFLSKDQLRVVVVGAGRIQLENLSRKVAAQLADGSALGPGDSREVGLPVRIAVGETLIEIEEPEEIDRATLHSVDRPVPTLAVPMVALSDLGETPSAEQLARWFETLVTVQRSAASSKDFYVETARAVVDLIGLDRGLVLLRHDDDWEVVARFGIDPTRGAEFSRTVLDFVRDERRTFFQILSETAPTRSQVAGSAVVVAPILGADDQSVVGAVYGARAPNPTGAGVAIRPLEAQLVQVLAAAVGAGLARLESEEKAARRHRQFMDFFSPELTRELDRNPKLLEGEKREVTVLFSDIRGFSRISERLSPEETCALVRDVMERLTRRIREHRGVVVDYIGDSILALWNAPVDQPDHAALACRAALAMLEEVPGLDGQWSGRIGGPFGLGIGLNTGQTLVGNTGSQSRFKYGPLGHAVNLASRVEGATKQLGVAALITGPTRDALGDHDFALRRLCKVEVVGIADPVSLYELHAGAPGPTWCSWRDTYEKGLRQFEAGELAKACRTLHSLLEGREGRYDLATLTLVGRAIEHLKDPSLPFSPVLSLSSK